MLLYARVTPAVLRLAVPNTVDGYILLLSSVSGFYHNA
jgi:hypothetical protein